jgi:hypothetical protein
MHPLWHPQADLQMLFIDARLPTETVVILLSRCTVAHSAIAARLAAAAASNRAALTSVEPDRLLTVEAAAGILSVTPRWLYRHAKGLPFTRRLSRKALRFSETGLRRWQATRRS